MQSERRTDEGDHNEIPVPKDALKDVELVVEPSAIKRVEDLSEDKGVEHECLHNLVTLICVV